MLFENAKISQNDAQVFKKFHSEHFYFARFINETRLFIKITDPLGY